MLQPFLSIALKSAWLWFISCEKRVNEREILIILIGKYASTKITFALADWIREWRKCWDKNAPIDEGIKFVKWKLEDYKLSDIDKRTIETILLY